MENFLNESGDFALAIDAIHQFLNLREPEARQKVDALKSLRALNAEGEKVYTTDLKWNRLKERLLKTLKEFHAAHPLVPGMDMEELRGKLGYQLSPKIFRVVVDLFITEKLIAKEENLLRLASHRVQLGGQEKVLMDKIKKILGEQPLAPPDLKEIEKQAGVPRNRLSEVIRLLEREGSVVRITTDMYFLASSIEQLRGDPGAILKRKGRDERRGVSRSDRFQPQVHDSVVGILRPHWADDSHRRHPQTQSAPRRGENSGALNSPDIRSKVTVL